MSVAVRLFGKLPCVGDFVRRNMTPELQRMLESEFSALIAELQARHAEDWKSALTALPPLLFLIPPGPSGVTGLGFARPSSDNVGRVYPLIVLAASDDVRSAGCVIDLARVWQLLGALSGVACGRQTSPDAFCSAVQDLFSASPLSTCLSDASPVSCVPSTNDAWLVPAAAPGAFVFQRALYLSGADDGKVYLPSQVPAFPPPHAAWLALR